MQPSAPPMSPVPPPPPLPSPPQPFDYDKESQHSRYFDAELAVIEEEPEKGEMPNFNILHILCDVCIFYFVNILVEMVSLTN